MRRHSVRLALGCALLLPLTSTFAAKDGELWEVSMQRASGGSALGPPETMRLCFGKGKDVKEPPQKDDPNCKTEVQTTGKKTTFKSVCKDPEGTITSSGTGEELGPYHYRNDVTIIQEMRGQPKMQERQVGTMKRIGTACDTNEMFERLKKGSAGQGGQPGAETATKSVKPSAPPSVTTSPSKSRSSPEQVTQPTEGATKAASEKESVAGQQSGPSVNDAVEAGKSVLRGLLKF